VKVVHLLLPYLPVDRRYRVVMMHRSLEEVLASQRKMLERQDRRSSDLDDEAMKRAFASQLKSVKRYLSRRACFELIEADYNALLSDPEPQIERLVEFLGLPGDPGAMRAVLDASLYRNRERGGGAARPPLLHASEARQAG
jgi:hypothetical protein